MTDPKTPERGERMTDADLKLATGATEISSKLYWYHELSAEARRAREEAKANLDDAIQAGAKLAALEKERDEANKRVEFWERKWNGLSDDFAALRAERDALRSRVTELEGYTAAEARESMPRVVFMDANGRRSSVLTPTPTALQAWIDRLQAERDALQRFKAYIHKRLDDAGVPHDPDPEHNAKHGCRIEGRLNYVLATHQALSGPAPSPGESADLLCALCGKPVNGYSFAAGNRLCHPDDKTKPDCCHLWTAYGKRPEPRVDPFDRPGEGEKT